jgi:hypothetical protein
MKISKEELLTWYENGISRRSFPWFNIDTSVVENLSDKELLGRITHIPAVEIPGFGLIAELCKRYNERE